MAMFLTPRGESLTDIDTLKNSTVGRLGEFTKAAEEVNKVIVSEVRRLLIEESRHLEQGRRLLLCSSKKSSQAQNM